MTPQERQLVDELFDRLARLEQTRRDAEAERVIADGLARAPHATYALVQTVLVQDEALRRADARIRELEGDDDEAAGQGGFLDSMRAALSGRRSTSVPSVGGGSGAEQRFDAQPALGRGGSFLGTAAASAAGAIGGALLLNTIGGMFGPHGGAQAAVPSPSALPDPSLADSDLARQAGIDHIGQAPDNRQAGLFDGADSDAFDDGDFDGDVGDFGDL